MIMTDNSIHVTAATVGRKHAPSARYRGVRRGLGFRELEPKCPGRVDKKQQKQ